MISSGMQSIYRRKQGYKERKDNVQIKCLPADKKREKLKRRQWRINKRNRKYCMPQISLLQQTATLGDNILLYMKNSLSALPQNYSFTHEIPSALFILLVFCTVACF